MESTPDTTQKQDTKETFTEGLRRRISATKPTRWVRFAIVAALFVAWVAWMGSWWLLIFLFLLFDIYITGYIPFSWWKKSKNPLVRGVMSWVDAIVYALILVYFIFNFVGQNYQIPSSSLEKTLLTGDFLWVNKLAYGPRVPMTPVHFPLVHNTLPVINTKSYTEWPSNSYRRLKGYRDVELGDIVVFNFPAGDTVALKMQNPDYYTLVAMHGREAVNSNKELYGDVVYRPVDRRENYVKRCVALPGDNFRISNDTIYLNGVAQPFPENVQFSYLIQLTTPLTPDACHEFGIALEDVNPEQIDAEVVESLREQGILPSADMNSVYYSLRGLSQPILEKIRNSGILKGAVKVSEFSPYTPYPPLFPAEISEGWTLSDYGGTEGIIVPKKGMKVRLNPYTWALYNRVIRNYEGHTSAYLDGDTVYIDGRPAEEYEFAMDYYFMMGDNRDNSQDSRFWGFVPEDHIVGTPMFVLISFDKDRGLFNGGIRWNRIFHTANPDK